MSDSNQSKTPSPLRRRGSFLLVAILLAIVLVQFLGSGSFEPSELNYNKFLTLMSDSSIKVKSLTVITSPEGLEIHGKRALTAAETLEGKKETNSWLERSDSRDFYVRVLDVQDSTLRRWAEGRGIQISVKEKGGAWMGYVLYLLPVAVFVALWVMMMRQGGGGAGGGRNIFAFGKSPARLMGKDVPRVTFDDVAGCDESKHELVEVIDFLKDPARYDRLGGKIPRGVLLMGPPGTGKTLLAKAVAGEAKVPFFSMSGSSFVEMFVGVGASRVRDLFEQAKKAAPCIIFIDEIDAVGRQRGAGLGGGHDEREQTLNQLLIEMDGFSGNDGVIIIAATNRPDILDSALLRPGRFDRRVVVDKPDVRGRLEILKVHTGTKIPLSPDVELERIARGTPGFSGADLANLCNEAALSAASHGKQWVEMDDFEEAKDKVFMGSERKSLAMTENDKRVTAFHEAGHAVVAWFTPGADPVHKVTIIPRGRALGLTWQLPERDRYNVTQAYLEGQIAIMMGGRLAEEMFIGEISTGASNDIQRATATARSMVCDYGMSEMGPLHFGENEHQVFLGRDLGQQRAISEDTARRIDAEIHRIVEKNFARARHILTEHRNEMEMLGKALLDVESVDEADIRKIFETGEMPKRKEVPAAPAVAEAKDTDKPDTDLPGAAPLPA
ncbi:MAG: ATP-dependent metalloprotease [Fibrobacterota bacterium]|jgi:cell division protease FtsH